MNAVEESIKKFIADEILHSGSAAALTADRLLLEEGILDSLGLQQLVAFLESEFAIKIDDDYLMPENFESVRAIAAFVSEIRD
jgi:acyl carrier protein